MALRRFYDRKQSRIGFAFVTSRRAWTQRDAEAPGVPAPVLAITGWSGSGKTTLLERVLPTLRNEGLHVAVVKHDAHGLSVDHPGKDSDRLFRAGGDVILQGPDETLVRLHRPTVPLLKGVLDVLTGGHDLVLVEGHKDTPLPKLWIDGRDVAPPPKDVSDVLHVLSAEDDQVAMLLSAIRGTLASGLRGRPLRGAILVGSEAARGRSGDAHKPKDRLEANLRVMKDAVGDVALIGPDTSPHPIADVAHLPDAPSVEGSIAGLLAALRWDPTACWLMASRFDPALSPAVIRSLLERRRPGTWAILPRTPDGGVSPYPGIYEPQSRALLEEFVRSGTPAPRRLADHPKVECFDAS